MLAPVCGKLISATACLGAAVSAAAEATSTSKTARARLYVDNDFFIASLLPVQALCCIEEAKSSYLIIRRFAPNDEITKYPMDWAACGPRRRPCLRGTSRVARPLLPGGRRPPR